MRREGRWGSAVGVFGRRGRAKGYGSSGAAGSAIIEVKPSARGFEGSGEAVGGGVFLTGFQWGVIAEFDRGPGEALVCGTAASAAGVFGLAFWAGFGRDGGHGGEGEALGGAGGEAKCF